MSAPFNVTRVAHVNENFQWDLSDGDITTAFEVSLRAYAQIGLDLCVCVCVCFQLKEKLGEGSFGVVFRAIHK